MSENDASDRTGDFTHLQTRDLRIAGYRLVVACRYSDRGTAPHDRRRCHRNRTRAEIVDILDGRDDRLVVVVGPCSVHDTSAALEYAHQLNAVSAQLAADLRIVMRVYFEKPRTDRGLDGA